MGTERLIVAAIAIAVANACRPAPRPATPQTAEPPRARHAQVVRAATTAAREAVFARFRERNGAAWSPVGRAAADVDPLRLVVRRAKRSDAPGGAPEVPEPDARAAALAFVRANADLLGVAPDDVATLDVETKDMTGAWAVHFAGHRPMRGYEGFDTVATTYDVTILVSGDGVVRALVNDSRVHPRLAIDTVPKLAPDDARVQKDVTGRELFVLVADPRRARAGVRELERVSVGRAHQADVKRTTLHVHVSVGPMAAYVMYTLAYAVDVERGGETFRFIVDADSGDLLEDAVAPVVARAP